MTTETKAAKPRGNSAKRVGRGQGHKPLWTSRQFDALKPEAEPYSVGDRDTRNLRHWVQPNGRKYWTFTPTFNGKKVKLTWEVSLGEARARARKALADIDEGIDPRDGHRARKQAARGGKHASGGKSGLGEISPAPAAAAKDRVETVVRLYIETYAEKHKRSWRKSEQLLKTKFLPAMRGRRLGEASAADFVKLLDDVADSGGIVANRLHAELSTMCKWASGQLKLKPGDKRVRLIDRNVFAGVSKPRSENKPRDRALTDAELARVMIAADGLGFPFNAIIKILVLTAQRRTEVGNLSWDEISDLDAPNPTWTLPAERSKNGEAHEIPLAPAVVRILRSLPRFVRRPGERDYCFSPGTTPPSSYSSNKAKLDKATGAMKAWALHDLRRSAATGMAKLGVVPHVIEATLNHLSGFRSGVGGIYNRNPYDAEKRQALQLWADHIATLLNSDVATTETSELIDA